MWLRRSRGAFFAAAVASDAEARRREGDTLRLVDLYKHVAVGVAARRQQGQGAAAWRRYETSCHEWGGAAPLPLTPEKALGFGLGECLRGISTSNLGQTLKALVGHAEDEGYATDGWDPAARRRVAAGVAALKTDFPAEIIRAAPMTDAVMRQVRRYLQPYLNRGDLYATMWWSMLTAAYAGLLRSIEFLSDALTPSQVYLEDGDGGWMLGLFLPFRKPSRTELDRESDHITLPRRPAAEADLDPLPAMQAYAAAAGITLGVGTGPLYVRRRKDGTEWPLPRQAADARQPQGLQYPQALSELKQLLAAAGVADADAYSWHSFRRGMATKLLAMGVPWDVVKKLGGWASDESMSNYDARGRAVAAAVHAAMAAPPALGQQSRGRATRGARGR